MTATLPSLRRGLELADNRSAGSAGQDARISTLLRFIDRDIITPVLPHVKDSDERSPG